MFATFCHWPPVVSQYNLGKWIFLCCSKQWQMAFKIHVFQKRCPSYSRSQTSLSTDKNSWHGTIFKWRQNILKLCAWQNTSKDRWKKYFFVWFGGTDPLIWTVLSNTLHCTCMLHWAGTSLWVHWGHIASTGRSLVTVPVLQWIHFHFEHFMKQIILHKFSCSQMTQVFTIVIKCTALAITIIKSCCNRSSRIKSLLTLNSQTCIG